MRACRSAMLLWRDRRAATALMVALMLPALLGAAGLGVDASIWYLQEHRLQLAADAAAHASAYLLGNDTNIADYQQVAQNEAIAVTGGRLIGTLQTPPAVSLGSNTVQVTLSATTPSVFARAVGLGTVTLRASATAGKIASATACVLALDKSGTAINVDNQGTIKASGCSIFSDSTASTALSLNSGTLSGKAIGTAGGFDESNSGSNSVSPTPQTGQGAEADPYAAATPPQAPTTTTATNTSCVYNSQFDACCNYVDTSFASNGNSPKPNFSAANNVFCGPTSFGGNGLTTTFANNTTYYFVDGPVTFSNARVASAAHVTFVLTGASAGAFSWENDSGSTSLTAPTSGATAGVLIWQECPASGAAQSDTFDNGSPLAISGAIYAPCAELTIQNNAQIISVNNTYAAVIADTVHATGSGGINIQGLDKGSASAGAVSLQQ